MKIKRGDIVDYDYGHHVYVVTHAFWIFAIIRGVSMFNQDGDPIFIGQSRVVPSRKLRVSEVYKSVNYMHDYFKNKKD